MPLSRSDAHHLLRRLGLGARPGEIAHFAGRELPDVLDEMFALAPGVPSAPAAVGEFRWHDAKSGTSDWWLDRLAAARWLGPPGTPSPLVEKLALFWHSHFACGTPKVREFRALWRQVEAYHRHGLGDFAVLATAIIADGGMLSYFDNVTNRERRPQENLARELMELHTIGVGAFTERDVTEMARAWTGFGVVVPFGPDSDMTPRFTRADHDAGPKRLFGLAPRRWRGPDTIAELVHGVKQRETARFVTAKLWRYYVDDAPSPAVIDDLADVFVASGMRIEVLLRAIVSHPTFWAPQTRWGMVRQPLEWATEILARFDISAAESNLTRLSRFMGQELFNPPNVNGWGTNTYWVSTTAVWGKARFLKWIRNNDRSVAAFADLQRGSRDAAVERILDRFGVDDPTAATRERVGEWFDRVIVDQPWAAPLDAFYIGGLLPEVQVA
jgi:uncharacterized protein (DUF1800 family)